MDNGDLSIREVGRMGGSVKSVTKAKSSAENGKKGGRPRTKPRESYLNEADLDKLREMSATLVSEAKEHAKSGYENGPAYDAAHNEFYSFLSCLNKITRKA
jgi:hypothetical protein